MNAFFLLFIGVPALEVFLMIKIGGKIGALNTVSLIFLTAITGIFFARLEGLNAIRSGFTQLVNNKVPIYEIISGAALAFAAFLLILPGFATDILGLLIIFPPTRKLFLKNVSMKYSQRNQKKQDFINGEFEDIDEDNDRRF